MKKTRVTTRRMIVSLKPETPSLAGIEAILPTWPDSRAELLTWAYHRLFRSKGIVWCVQNDLAARPIYHHKRKSIEAHLPIVSAALAVGRRIGDRNGSIRVFVFTARRPCATRSR